MNFKNFIVLFSFSAFLACSTARKPSTSEAVLSEKSRMEFDYLFYNANKEKLLGNNEQAINLFHQALQINKTNPAASFELAKLYLKVNRPKDALFYAKQAYHKDQENKYYSNTYAEALLRNNLINEASALYEDLVKRNPKDVNLYFDWANVLLTGGKYNDAAKVYDKIEDVIGIKPEISYQKERIYLKLNKVDKAIDEIQKLVNAFPKEPEYYERLANLYQANNMHEKAFEVLKKLEELNPDYAKVHLSLANYYRTMNNREKAFEELQKAFADKNLDVETEIQILTSYLLLLEKYPELKEQAFALCKMMIAAHPNDAKAYAMYGDLLYNNKQPDEARKQYRESIRLDKDHYIVWQQLILIESQLGDYNAMLAETEEAITLFPNQPLIYLFNGIAKSQNKKYEEALQVLNSGLKQVTDNNALLIQFYAQLGDVYNKLKDDKESDKAFEKALKIDPKNSFVLNNYSYYLSLRGDSLEKAEKMSLLSINLEPDNYNFLDTYAWILYQGGKLTEAKNWLEKALESGGNKNSVILEHYGDVLYRLDQKGTALDFWRKAKEAGTGSDLLEKKIIDKKLYE